jgi:hypothetical protein
MLGALPQDEDHVPPYPNNGQQLPVEFFGMGQPVVNVQFDLNIPPPMGGMKMKKTLIIMMMLGGMLGQFSRFSLQNQW